MPSTEEPVKGEQFEEKIGAASRRLSDEMREERFAEERRKEQQQRVARRRHLRSRIFFLLAMGTCVGLTAFNLAGPGLFPIETAALTQEDLENFLWFEVEEVHAYVEEFGQLPAQLSDLALSEDGSWSYERVADGFRLALIEGDTVLMHDSLRPDKLTTRFRFDGGQR